MKAKNVEELKIMLAIKAIYEESCIESLIAITNLDNDTVYLLKDLTGNKIALKYINDEIIEVKNYKYDSCLEG